MADTTNDIWNDRDGEREAPPKRHILRNFLIFLLVLIVVLGVVLAAAWRDGTGFDVLRRYFTYGTVSGAGDKTGFQFDADNSNRFAEIGNGGLVIVSDTSIRLLSADGSELWSARKPACWRGFGNFPTCRERWTSLPPQRRWQTWG